MTTLKEKIIKLAQAPVKAYLSHGQIAKRVGCSRPYVSKVLKGRKARKGK